MKKFVKYTALTALILTGLGIVLLTIGAIGGSVKGIQTLDVIVDKIKAGELSIDEEDLDRFGETLGRTGANVGDLIEELGDLGVDIEGLFEDLDIDIHYGNVEDSIRFSSNHITYEGGSQQFTVESNEVSKMNLSMSGSQITFKKSYDGNFHVQANHIGKLQAYVEGNTFYLKSAKIGLNITLSDIVLEVPEGVSFDTIDLDVGAGSVEISELEVERLYVSVGAGDFSVDYLDADEVRLDVGAGNIDVKDGNIGYLKGSVGAGCINVESVVTGDIDADVAMGELVVVVKGSDESKHNYKIDCAMGEAQIGSQFWSGLAISDKYINNGADSTYDLDCALGSLIITFED